MDSSKRLAVALVLAAAILFVWNTWVQPPKPQPRTQQSPAAATAGGANPAFTPAAATPAQAGPVAATPPGATVSVRSPLYEYDFSTRGAGLAQAELLKFPSYVEKGKNVQLVPRGAGTVFSYRLVGPEGVVDLRDAECAPSAPSLMLGAGGGNRELRFTCAIGGRPTAEIAYTFRPDNYLVDIRGRFLGGHAGTLLADLGTGLAAHDA
ncbi:MAG TPA: membrane protein insertase YidC, partial [Longimicrobium sp.]|nr:membrane protein insertase YidC [Longimicrobium sp.]